MYTNQKSMIFLSCSSVVKVAGYCSPAGFKLIWEEPKAEKNDPTDFSLLISLTLAYKGLGFS